MHNKSFILFHVVPYIEVRCLTEHFPSQIDYLRALDSACLKCGDKHQPDCPVGMAKAQINDTNDLLTEFYKRR